jgi:hypothetical protein
MLPYRFDAETYPMVLMPNSDTYVFVPTDRRFKGFEFTIPTFPEVTKDVRPFVNWTVLDVVFPLFTTASSVVAIDEVVMELSLPFESIVS